MTDGTLHVYTWRDGLLSKLGHDLRLRVEPFEVVRDGAQLTASCRADAVRLESAMVGGVPTAGLLSDKDTRDIHKNLDRDVLQGGKYPIIRYVGRVEGDRLVGDLELTGKARRLEIPLTREGGRLRGQVEFAPSLWGIKPFKALLGALRIQDRVQVRFDLPEHEA
ncbi:MAG: YceI family protein [Deltaproteobacteria bacterium]|nr:YceI family protein [Deltaproteobacteria bacterium]